MKVTTQQHYTPGGKQRPARAHGVNVNASPNAASIPA